MDGDGDMTTFDRLRRVFVGAWPFAASAAGMAVVLMATIVSVAAIRDRDRLAAVATNAAAAARDAKAASDAAAARAAEAAPCNPGDPPDTPGCKRDEAMAAQVRSVVAQINEALAGGLAAHDLNAHEDHEDLRRLLTPRSAPAPARAPITAPVRVPPTTRPPAPPPPATTTTTTCPRLPNGKCRP